MISMTVVEKFIEQLEKQGDVWENASIGRIQISIDVEDYLKIKEQAKAMEKEQSLKMLPYDLDELAEGYANYMNNDNGTSDIDFKEGFQKALELLTFKSE